MPFIQFVGLDLLGALAYAFAYGSIGFIFRDFLAFIVRGFQAAGKPSTDDLRATNLLTDQLLCVDAVAELSTTSKFRK